MCRAKLQGRSVLQSLGHQHLQMFASGVSSTVRRRDRKEPEEPQDSFTVTYKCQFQFHGPSPECACVAFNGKEESSRPLRPYREDVEAEFQTRASLLGLFLREQGKQTQMAYYITSRCLASPTPDEEMAFSWFIWRLWPCCRHTEESSSLRSLLQRPWPCSPWSFQRLRLEA